MKKELKRLKKIYALALDGVGGEKETAQLLLEKLMKKHGITLEEIKGLEKYTTSKNVKNGYRVNLYCQVCSYILSSESLDTLEMWKNRSTTKIVGLMTVEEKIDVLESYEFHVKLFEEERKRLLHAFIYKHNLYNQNPKVREDGEMPSDEEIKEHLKTQRMAVGLSDNRFKKVYKLNADSSVQ